MNVSHDDILRNAVIKRNARGASSGAEGSPVQQSEGVSNCGCEGENGKEREWWHLPGGENLTVGDRDKDKEDDQACPQEKKDLDISKHDFLSSGHVNNSGARSAPRDKGKEDDQFYRSLSDLQHSCYCSNPSCGNIKCNHWKAKVEHMKTHKEWMQCSDCERTRDVVEKHAQTCCVPGCRVPLCYSIRKVKGDKGNVAAKRKPFKAPLVPWPLVPGAPMNSKFPLWGPWCNISHVNGKVIFRNTDLMPGDYFLENRDYIVKDKVLGRGGVGKVYEVSVHSDSTKEVVVKKTTKEIGEEELEVYELLGDHKHIVKHLGVTQQGSKGRARIFMELCDDSVYNYMENTLKRRLSVAEAMFYWLQIREAVEYLHNRGIIHKDIKAKNVLMKGRRVLLADFDTAMRLLNKVTEKGLKPRGTKGFVSPEVWDRAPHGRPADIFSMGCFLIEMTIGAPVNDTLKEKILMLRKLDSELAELVETCVSQRPEDRPTARSLLHWPVVKRYSCG